MTFSYAYIFLQSSCLELLIYSMFYSSRLSLKDIFLVVTAANAITHPFVFFGFMQSPLTYLTAILLAELFAIVSETLLHGFAGRLKLRKAFLAAIFANLFSWQVAPILTYFGLLA